MNILKYISTIVLALFVVSGVFAQEKKTDTIQMHQPAEQKVNVKINYKKVGIDSLVRRVNERNKRIFTSKPREKVDLLDSTLIDKNAIIKLLNDSIKILNDKSLRVQNTINEQEKENKVIRFFKIEDTSIFTNKFEKFSLSEIPLCLREHYQLISDIRDLNRLLEGIGQKIVEIESDEKYKNLPENTQKEVFKSYIRKDLDTANVIIGKIEATDKSCLFPEQANYYRPLLIDKFNGFLELILADE